MSRDVLTVGSTMRIPLLYRGEYSQWVKRFMNYLEEQTDGEAMINSIKNGIKHYLVNKTTKDLWDALATYMLGSEYVINDLKKCGYSKDNCKLNSKVLNNLQPEWKQYATMMRQNKNLTDINIDALYNILKQNKGDYNDDMGLKKKTVVVTFDPLALIAEKTKVSKSKEKVVVSSDSEGSDSANKKQEFVKSDDKKEDKKTDEKKRDLSKVKCYNYKKEGHFAKDYKKAKVKDYNFYKTKMLLAKKDSNEQVLLAEDQAWMESKSDESSSSTEETIAEQTSLLKPYVPTVILEKIIIDLEDEVVSLLEKEKANLKKIESLKSKGFESSENAISESENQRKNDCHVIEKECDQVENSKVIAPGMFKLYLDTFSSVRRPKHSGVFWKKKGSSNTSIVDLSSVSNSKVNKDVKRYSHKDVLSGNNSHLGETSSAYVCNDVMNVSCNSRWCDSFDENNLFIFDDESVRISPVSKMPFRKKPRDSLNVRSKSNSNKSVPRTMHRWLSKMQPLAKPIAKWILRIVQICLWIIDLGCSKHMTGNRALLKNFVEKFLGTVCFENNDFVVIVGYGDVAIGSMTIKK
nr:integrase, catalytic region, zinc finger, CCHC-type, peptidase aspartic, catalytic [Tanacetum cinerariifolium]